MINERRYKVVKGTNTFRKVIPWRRRYVSTEPNLRKFVIQASPRSFDRYMYLYPSLSVHLQLDFEPVKLKVPWVIGFTVFTPPDGYLTDVRKA